jgi:hypothetical protein
MIVDESRHEDLVRESIVVDELATLDAREYIIMTPHRENSSFRDGDRRGHRSRRVHRDDLLRGVHSDSFGLNGIFVTPGRRVAASDA